MTVKHLNCVPGKGDGGFVLCQMEEKVMFVSICSASESRIQTIWSIQPDEFIIHTPESIHSRVVSSSPHERHPSEFAWGSLHPLMAVVRVSVFKKALDKRWQSAH